MPKFYKLKREKENNAYIVLDDYRKQFHPIVELDDDLDRCIEFAYNMTFGGKGVHRDHRTGGVIHRSNVERFQNAFQGKIAECGLYTVLSRNHLAVGELDFATYGRGEWDDCDITVGNARISVKSAAHFSQLLLLERRDWDENGLYIPDNQTEENGYDYFVLCRVKPNVKDLFRDANIKDDDISSIEDVTKIIKSTNRKWQMDIPGYITREDLKSLINERFILPQGVLLNGRMRMDAENYYCRAFDMRWLNHLIQELGGHR